MSQQDPICHVVITRFATRLTPDGQTPTREWVDERIDIFERYCLRSMLAQSRSFDAWLLLVDPALPQDVVNRIRAYEDALTPIRVAPVSHFHASDEIAALARECMRPAHEALLTTRLDNDDAVSIDFVERLRSAAADCDVSRPQAFVFTRGYELADGHLYWRDFPRSPFASLLEPSVSTRPMVTVIATGHEELDELAPVRELGAPAAWIQVIHGGNVLNRIRGLRTRRDRLAGHFVIDDPALLSHERQAEVAIGWVDSAALLAWRLVTTPRYWRKVAQVVRLRSGKRT